MTHPSAKRICLGEISTAHGVRGLVRIRVYGDDPQAFSAYGPLFISETSDKTITIKMKNAANKFWIAEVEGVADRNAAEALRGTKLWIERDKLPEPESDDEFYYEDLIGMTVQTDGEGMIGTVVAVENFGASDLLEIKPPSGSTFYLPFVDEYILEVNMPENVIKVDIPLGLRD
ncbi:MAG: ribosome maturation factor RimM [Alphaproteobacteria bacterium]|nr:ribosome maturation factor RimM [Alphaproteobacteria bacterium]